MVFFFPSKCVRHDAWIFAVRLVHSCDKTSISMRDTYLCLDICVTWLYFKICDTTYSFVWQDSSCVANIQASFLSHDKNHEWAKSPVWISQHTHIYRVVSQVNAILVTRMNKCCRDVAATHCNMLSWCRCNTLQQPHDLFIRVTRRRMQTFATRRVHSCDKTSMWV